MFLPNTIGSPVSRFMHPKYTERVSEWEDVRNGISGGRRIKYLGVRYLPKNDDEARYNSVYLKRARWPVWLEQAFLASMGQIFRRDPMHTLAGVDFLENSAGPGGESLYNVSQMHIRESLQAGAVLLIDAPIDGGNPYISVLPRARATDWGYIWRSGKLQLEYVVLSESVLEKGKNIQRYRRLYLDEGVYRQKVMKGNGQMIEEKMPEFNGQPINFLPIVIHSSYQVTPEPMQSPLTGLFDVCLEAYQYSADIGWTAKHNAQPVLKVKGHEGGDLKNSHGIMQLPPDGDADFLRLEGSTFLTGRYDAARTEAESLGAQISAPQASAQTATGALIALAASTANLTLTTVTASEAMTQAIRMLGRWQQLSESAIEGLKFEYNTRFAESEVAPGKLAELLESFLRGGISAEDYVAELRRADFGDASKDYSAEVRRLEQLKSSLGSQE